jgi:hypothetical protein
VIGICVLAGSLASAPDAWQSSSTHHGRVVDRASTVAPPTRTHHIAPVDSSGQLKPAYRIIRSARGYCWTTSFLNPGLYRCFLGNFILDPCWTKAGRGAVLCLERPWSHQVTRLRLTKRLPRTSAGHGGLWGLTLASGLNCQVPGGTHDIWRGHDVNYYCPRHEVLLDQPDRSAPTWRIRTARYLHRHYHGRGLRDLSDAWRAAAP